jgi:hypothetical protein
MIPAAIVNDTRADRHYGCYAVMDAIERLCAANGLAVVERVPVHHDWQADAALMERLSRVRLIVVNGEGTIHHDRPAARRLVAIGAFARANGIASALVNASWHANPPELAAQARAFDRVAVRESASGRALADAGVAAQVMPDLSIEGLVPWHGARRGVRVAGSVVARQSWALARARRRVKGGALSILAPRDTAAAQLRFDLAVAGVRAPGAAAHWREVVQAWSDLRRGRVPDAAAFEAAVRGAALLVTGRFHAATIALGLGTPLLAVESNTAKISATLADAGLAAWRVTNVANITPDTCAAAATWDRGELSGLEAWRSEGAAAQRRLFADLAALAG